MGPGKSVYLFLLGMMCGLLTISLYNSLSVFDHVGIFRADRSQYLLDLTKARQVESQNDSSGWAARVDDAHKHRGE